ncbi:ORF6N domain-containing protein [Candidatus Saccharibacteria bacterium]|nr:ORF6N domain-containing protein [Candidatus Saccharibacteria bacterium]
MNNLTTIDQIESSVVSLRGQKVLIDADVARFYGVETKRINEAIKNNPDKFPDGYILSLHADEWQNLKSKFSTSSWGGKNKLPKAFTEKGLYMLATILKSPRATATTLAIVETFTKIRELTGLLSDLPDSTNGVERQALIDQSSQIMSGLLDENMRVSETETTVEVNFAVMKVKHTVKRGRKQK